MSQGKEGSVSFVLLGACWPILAERGAGVTSSELSNTVIDVLGAIIFR